MLFFPVAPKWVEEPTNTSLLLGQRGIVDCNANGYPTPQIHWMKRDGNYSHNVHIVLVFHNTM